jgi:hypothetical protein
MIIHRLISWLRGDPVVQTYDNTDYRHPLVMGAIRLHYGHWDGDGYAAIAVAVHKSGRVVVWTKGGWVDDSWQLRDSEKVKEYAEIECGMRRLKAATLACGRRICAVA